MEAVAADEYVAKCGVELTETGFWAWRRGADAVIAGGSPDGLVSDQKRSSSSALKGIIEIKCLNSAVRPRRIASSSYHVYQCQMNTMITDRSFCDYISWTPLCMRVERIPRADHVPVGQLGFGAHDVAFWTARGVYDPKTRTWPGCIDVFYGVVRSFHRQATGAASTTGRRGSSTTAATCR